MREGREENEKRRVMDIKERRTLMQRGARKEKLREEEIGR